MSKISVLFVCMGNICRSPTAEGVFNHLVQAQGTEDRFHLDSAGTHAYHVGETPDARSQQMAESRGVDLSYIRARKFTADDFDTFDYILAMDTDNYDILMDACPSELQHKVKLFLEYAPEHPERDVPDPYYGGQRGFERVFDLVEAASQGFHNAVI
jgi:protein-tyrosine phosphatase